MISAGADNAGVDRRRVRSSSLCTTIPTSRRSTPWPRSASSRASPWTASCRDRVAPTRTPGAAFPTAAGATATPTRCRCSSSARRCPAVGAMLFGRRTYEDLLGYWTTRPEPNLFTDALVRTPKYVVSRSAGTALGYSDSTLLAGEAVETVAAPQGEVSDGSDDPGQRRAGPRPARRPPDRYATSCRSTRSCSGRAPGCSARTIGSTSPSSAQFPPPPASYRSVRCPLTTRRRTDGALHPAAALPGGDRRRARGRGDGRGTTSLRQLRRRRCTRPAC